MDDPLLQRADRAIRDSKYLVDRAHENLLQAMLVSARTGRTLEWVRERHVGRRQPGVERADMAGSGASECPADQQHADRAPGK
jgi:hypothetical protein